MKNTLTFNGKVYYTCHGSPFNRGMEDSFCGRDAQPHFFCDATHQDMEIYERFMTKTQIDAYLAGYEYNRFLF